VFLIDEYENAENGRTTKNIFNKKRGDAAGREGKPFNETTEKCDDSLDKRESHVRPFSRYQLAHKSFFCG
jgi:hypothetical protein